MWWLCMMCSIIILLTSCLGKYTKSQQVLLAGKQNRDSNNWEINTADVLNNRHLKMYHPCGMKFVCYFRKYDYHNVLKLLMYLAIIIQSYDGISKQQL